MLAVRLCITKKNVVRVKPLSVILQNRKRATFTMESNVENLQIINKELEARPYEEIPGPKGLPLIGNSWRFTPFIGQYKICELDKVLWSLYHDYGQIVKISGLIGHPDLLFVFNGDEICHVFRREETLPHRPSMPSLHYYKQVLRKDFFGDTAGLIGIHGKRWDDFRSEVQQILLKPSTARKYVGPLNDIADDFMDRISEIRDENNELPDDFLNELYKWALESVCRFSLDIRLGCLEKELTLNSEAQHIINSINVFFHNVAEVELRMPVWRIYQNKAFKKYIGALDNFRELCMKYITRAMEKMNAAQFGNDNRNEEDISVVERILRKTGHPKVAAVLALDLLLVGIDTVCITGCFSLMIMCIHNFNCETFISATDCIRFYKKTSVAATSTIYQLSQNSTAQEKLFNELKTIFPDVNTPVTINHLDQLSYLKACIKETLRMYPVILGNGRSLQSDAIISGFYVPKGTHVIFPHYVVANLVKYVPEPEQFRPERWLKKTVTGFSSSFMPSVKYSYDGKRTMANEHKQDNNNIRKLSDELSSLAEKNSQEQTMTRKECSHQIHPFVSLPFGYGRRTCIGRRFAEIELQILLAKIFRRYQVNYNYGKLTYKVSPTYIPREPLKFRLTERKI